MTDPIIDRAIIEVLPDFGRFREEYNTYLDALGDSLKVRISPNMDGFRAELDAKIKEVTTTAKHTVPIKLDIDTTTSSKAKLAGEEAGGLFSKGFKSKLAEGINALPFAGGLGTNAAAAVAGGIVVGSPLIAAAVSSAVALGVGASGVAAGLLIAFQDPRIKAAGAVLAQDLGSALREAATPFTAALASAIPKLGQDFASLKPQLAGIFTTLAPVIDKMEHATISGISAALPGIAKAASNSVQYMDVLAQKAPQIGAAIGEALAKLTDTSSLGFFKGLIDFINAAVVGFANFIQWLSKLNEGLGPLEHALGAVFKGFLEGVGAVLGPIASLASAVPKLTSLVVAGAAAWYLYQKRATQAAVASEATFAVSAAGEASAVKNPGFFGGKGRMIGGAALGIGSNVIGDAVGGTAGTFISSIGTGAGLGLAVGGPIGAGVGAAAGLGLALVTTQQDAAKKSADEFGKSLKLLATDFKGTGQVSATLTSELTKQDSVLKSLSKDSKFGLSSLSGVVAAISSNDPQRIQTELGKAQEERGKFNRKDHPLLFNHEEVERIDALDKLIPKLQDAKAQADADAAAFHSLFGTWAAGEQEAKSMAAAALLIATAFINVNQAVANYQARLSSVTNTIAPPQLVGPAQALHAFDKGVQAVGDAKYNQGITKQSVDDANVAASNAVSSAYHAEGQAAIAVADANHGVAEAHYATQRAAIAITDANHNLAESHYATQQAALAVIQSTKALTQARQQAADSIRSYRQELAGMAVSEESAREANENAKRAAYAAGIYKGPIESGYQLQQETLKNNLTSAGQSYSNLLANDKAKRPQLTTLISKGVEGQDSVISALQGQKNASHSYAESVYAEGKARDAQKQAQRAYSSALYAEGKAHQAAREAVYQHGQAVQAYGLALHKQTETTKAGKRQEELAKRAVDDATYALIGPGGLVSGLTAAELASGLTTAEIRDQLVPQLTAINKNWLVQITADPTAAINNINSVYTSLQTLAAGLGITLPNIGPSTNVGAAKPGQQGYYEYSKNAEGGLIGGHSPHDKADNIPIMATAREFMEPVHAVDYYGVDTFEAMRQHRIPREAIRGFAAGGQVLGSQSAGTFDVQEGNLVSRWLRPTTAEILRIKKAVDSAVKAIGGGGGGSAGASDGKGSHAVIDEIIATAQKSGFMLGQLHTDAAGYRGSPHGGHTYHTKEKAVDFGGAGGGGGKDSDGLAVWFMKNYGGSLLELIHSSEPNAPWKGWYIKHGQTAAPYGPASNHYDHVHVAANLGFSKNPKGIAGGDNGPVGGSIAGNIPKASSVTLKGVFGDELRKMLTEAAAIAAASDTVSGGDGAYNPSPASANVAKIAAAKGKSMGADSKAMLALFEAGLVESEMRNLLKATDHDSLGFLQQRPSMGWPDPTNIATATHSFLAKAMAKEPWSGSAGSLAQSVQRSAFPAAYDKRQADARALLAQYGVTADNGAILPPHSSTLVNNNTSQPEHVGFGLTADEMRHLALLIAQAMATQPAQLKLADETIIATKLIEPAVRSMISTAGMAR